MELEEEGTNRGSFGAAHFLGESEVVEHSMAWSQLAATTVARGNNEGTLEHIHIHTSTGIQSNSNGFQGKY